MAQSWLLGSKIAYKKNYLLTQLKRDILQIVAFQTFLLFNWNIFSVLLKIKFYLEHAVQTL